MDFGDAASEPKASRSVFLDGQSMSVPVYDRTALPPGSTVTGPVIVEERETTVFVLPDWDLEVDHDGSLIAIRRS